VGYQGALVVTFQDELFGTTRRLVIKHPIQVGLSSFRIRGMCICVYIYISSHFLTPLKGKIPDSGVVLNDQYYYEIPERLDTSAKFPSLASFSLYVHTTAKCIGGFSCGSSRLTIWQVFVHVRRDPENRIVLKEIYRF
jgi:hypothetical protein